MTSKKQKVLFYKDENITTPWAKRIEEVEELLMEQHYGMNYGFRVHPLPRHRLNDLKFGNATIYHCVDLIEKGGRPALHDYLMSLITWHPPLKNKGMERLREIHRRNHVLCS